VSVPVNQSAEAIWLLVTGFTHPMQERIANAVLCFRYADGVEERLELTPPFNFRSLCPWRSYDQPCRVFAPMNRSGSTCSIPLRSATRGTMDSIIVRRDVAMRR